MTVGGELMIKAGIITNIPAPYSLDLFKTITDVEPDIDLNIVFSAMSRKNRQWTIDQTKLKNVHSLDAYIISKRDGDYIRYIHIPKGTWKTLNKINPDILLVYEYNITSVISMIWAKRKNRKFVHVTEGTLWSENNIGFFQKILRRFILHYSDFCVACSSKSKEKLLKWKVSNEKIATILLTSDISKYKEIRHERGKKSEINLLYVGSVERGKGIDLLINSLKYIKTPSKLVVRIVGNGSKKNIDEIQGLIKKENVEADVILTGFLEGEQLLEEYRKADVFVFPSRSDCYGLVLVEAYSAGIPIVASMYADGAYDVVENGVNGIIEDPYDAKAVGSAITKIINDNAYKINALQMDTEKFDIATEAMGYIDIIKKYSKEERDY